MDGGGRCHFEGVHECPWLKGLEKSALELRSRRIREDLEELPASVAQPSPTRPQEGSLFGGGGAADHPTSRTVWEQVGQNSFRGSNIYLVFFFFFSIDQF
ncbi:hypothetical protein QJS04_geneDACA018260 [Acorus gramineus]|uniref:Uncharacterized protein n=1 Tax=Acorus gramineus TaxID=55184 RepID=A0AAV9BU38_ACOGR|nr:hypothetical protein QJS04_geneDACA018260 [Acorus gramineus]